MIGSHMRLCIPAGVNAVFFRGHPDPHDPRVLGFDVFTDDLRDLLDRQSPGAVVNLAGVSDVDCVERAKSKWTDTHAQWLNAYFPAELAAACARRGIKYVHISSQAVFTGKHPPYNPGSRTGAVNTYGRQKIFAEASVRQHAMTVIIRPSLVLGIRPLPHVGRKNPLESMLDRSQLRQVADRWFSPLFARDAAEGIWNAVLHASPGSPPVHLGVSAAWSRFNIAHELSPDFVPVRHSDFPGIAERPVNTVYQSCWPGEQDVPAKIRELAAEYESGIADRAKEIALFLGEREDVCADRLRQGFGPLHEAVTADFRAADAGASSEALRAWYMTTGSYIWELSAYHEDVRFNYTGMLKGIADRLLAAGGGNVSCLGDGIGDMTLYFRMRGLSSYYHDLLGSVTARYAEFRYWRKTGQSLPFPPAGPQRFNAIVSADFLEHVPDVEQRVRDIHDSLMPGGLFFAQNAFACGSGPDGAMPMHLAGNDHWEHDWDPLLREIGFVQEASNWYARKPE